MLLSLHFLCVPFLDCLQYVCVFVLYLWAQRWTQISLTGPEQRERVTFLDWLLMLFLMQSRKQWESNRLLCCTGTLWAHNPPNVQHDTTNLFFFLWHFPVSQPSVCTSHGVRCSTCDLSFLYLSSCQLISPACWMATQVCGVWTCLPNFISSTTLLRVYSVLILVRYEGIAQYWSYYQPLGCFAIGWPLVGLHEGDHNPLSSAVQPLLNSSPYLII